MEEELDLICSHRTYRNWQSFEENISVVVASTIVLILNLAAVTLIITYRENQNKTSTELFLVFFFGNGLTLASKIIKHSRMNFITCEWIHVVYVTHQFGMFTSSIALFTLVFINHFLAKARVALNSSAKRKLAATLSKIIAITIPSGLVAVLLPIFWNNYAAFSLSLIMNVAADIACFVYAIKLRSVLRKIHFISAGTQNTSFASQARKTYLQIFPAVIVTSGTRLLYLFIYILSGYVSSNVEEVLKRFGYLYYSSFVFVVIAFIIKGKYNVKLKQSFTKRCSPNHSNEQQISVSAPPIAQTSFTVTAATIDKP